jgi:hypothetical protein
MSPCMARATGPVAPVCMSCLLDFMSDATSVRCAKPRFAFFVAINDNRFFAKM